jgi:hypothetical protein
LLQKAKPLDALSHQQASMAPVIETWLRDHHRSAADVVWLPLKSRTASLTMLLDRSTGQPLDALQIDPW